MLPCGLNYSVWISHSGAVYVSIMWFTVNGKEAFFSKRLLGFFLPFNNVFLFPSLFVSVYNLKISFIFTHTQSLFSEINGTKSNGEWTFHTRWYAHTPTTARHTPATHPQHTLCTSPSTHTRPNTIQRHSPPSLHPMKSLAYHKSAGSLRPGFEQPS